MNNQGRNTLGEEFHLIPVWAYLLAGALFVCMQVLFNYYVPRQANPPPAPLSTFLGLLTGFVIACYAMLVGYVNVDSGRRGMNRTGWTLIAAFVPNALGFVLYFLLRKPAQQPCPQCGFAVEAGFNFCPHCNAKLHPHCAQCQRPVRLSDVYCSYCGYELDKITPVGTRTNP